MDRNQEVLALINNAKNELNHLTEKQREISHNIENTLNMANQNKVQVICRDYLDRLKTIDAKQLDLNNLLETKRVDLESNADIVKTLDKAENTLIKLEEFCRNKKERNLEKSMITDIMVCYWNAVGIKLQFGAEHSSTTLLLTNHDQENSDLKECKIEMNISKEHFEVIDVEPKSRLEEMKKIERDVKANGQGLTILVFKLYAQFVGE